MNLVIVGTIGLDDIQTPFGKVGGVLGGSGAYASCAASLFAQSALCSIVGNDMPQSMLDMLKNRKINLEGIERKGRNFRWSGSYEYDMNEAKTLKTELNSLIHFNPILPESYRQAKFVFLANVDPEIQLKVIKQLDLKSQHLGGGRGANTSEVNSIDKPFITIDTMNYWIASKPEKLRRAISKSNLVVMNEEEARQLFDTPNLIKAGRMMLEMGPKYAVIKKGEHGALLFSDNDFFSAPGYPLEEVVDPTGAGDTFTGAIIGYLAKTKDTSPANMRKAVIYGSTLASFCAEHFSLGYLDKINQREIRKRYRVFREIRKF